MDSSLTKLLNPLYSDARTMASAKRILLATPCATASLGSTDPSARTPSARTSANTVTAAWWTATLCASASQATPENSVSKTCATCSASTEVGFVFLSSLENIWFFVYLSGFNRFWSSLTPFLSFYIKLFLKTDLLSIN